MRQKFYSFLLTALFGMFGMNAWAQTTYEITDAQDLVDFAAAVNGGETSANAILMDNIDLDGIEWTPIGNASAKYEGTFDGQDFAITGFEYTAKDDNGNGLFGYVKNATIKNFSISGVLTSDGYTYNGTIGAAEANTVISGIRSALNITLANKGAHSGGILGSTVTSGNPVLVENCEYSGTMTHTGSGDCQAGILGYTYNGGVKNCLFSGTIIGESSKYGGILGYCKRPEFLGVQNCLSTGKIVANSGNTTAAAIIANYNGGATSNVKNNYYCLQEGSTTTIAIGNKASSCEAPVAVTAEQLASGEICYRLNGDQSTFSWFQALKNMVFIAETYETTVNGTKRAPKSADVNLVENDEGTFDFTLPNFVVETNSYSFVVGDISLEDITITSEGTFSKGGKFSVPDENIPGLLITMGIPKEKFKDIPYTLNGKVNGEKLYATINDISFDLGAFGSFSVSVEVGTDDFEAKGPEGTAYPTPYGTKIVYANGTYNCDMTLKEGSEVTYSNTDASFIAAHDFADGLCAVCGSPDETYMTPNGDGFYEIGTPAQLKWFAAYVNQVSVAANAVLTANIDLSSIEWTPIGFGDSYYTGTFDGQGFTISNFNVTTNSDHYGLFGKLGGGAVVKNFTIEGSINSLNQYVGVIGSAGGGTINISDIHSYLNITCAKSRHAGVLGFQSSTGTINIDRCIYSGTLDAGNTTGNLGGIMGLTQNNTSAYVNITDCLFDGTILDGTGSNAGGILGYANKTKVTIKNCLSVGTVISTNPSPFIGQLNASNSKWDGKNYYTTEGNPVGLPGSGVTVSGPEPIKATDAQLASGEVAYNLGSAWHQNIGDDDAPGLDVTHGIVNEITAAGYATMYVPGTDVTIPAGVEAFTGEIDGSWLKMTAVTGAFAAGEPVVLKGAEGYYSFIPTTGATKAAKNDLKASDEDVEAAGKYVLAMPAGEEVGFYKASTGTIKAGKAYLEVSGGEIKGYTFVFGEDDATGLNDLKSLNDANGAIYNVAGQRIQKMQKGINIVAGKKVLF